MKFGPKWIFSSGRPEFTKRGKPVVKTIDSDELVKRVTEQVDGVSQELASQVVNIVLDAIAEPNQLSDTSPKAPGPIVIDPDGKPTIGSPSAGLPGEPTTPAPGFPDAPESGRDRPPEAPQPQG